jgi:hypothetical protein
MWSRLFNDIIFSSWAESLSAYILLIVEFRYEYTKYTQAEFLDKIQTTVLRVFLCYSQTPLQLCFEISIS